MGHPRVLFHLLKRGLNYGLLSILFYFLVLSLSDHCPLGPSWDQYLVNLGNTWLCLMFYWYGFHFVCQFCVCEFS